MNALAEAGRHEEAQMLHERTRHVLGLGPLRIYDIVSARQAAADGQGEYRELLGGRRIAEPDVSSRLRHATRRPQPPPRMTSPGASYDPATGAHDVQRSVIRPAPPGRHTV